jgi:hypothetical protein
MIVANYTPDTITYTHSGSTSTIKPGELKDLEDSKANFILNKFDRRGLVALKFGDIPEKKREEAMKTYKAFWTRQILVYNQDNERRKNTQREYAEPTEQLVEHAKELGIEIIGPWTVKQTDSGAVQALRDENATLKSQLSLLSQQIADLANAMKAREVPFELRSPAEKVMITQRGAESQLEVKPPAPVAPIDTKPLIAEFQMLTREKFGEWVMLNADRIQANDYPPDVRLMIEDKWERLVKGEFPFPK